MIGDDQYLAEMKARFVAAIRTIAKEQSDNSRSLDPVLAVGFLFLLLLSLTIVFIPLLIKYVRKWRQIRGVRAIFDETVQFAGNATPVMAFPLMVNNALRSQGETEAPGLFIICFETGEAAKTDFMAEVASRITDPDQASRSPEEANFCIELLRDERFVPFRRRRLMPSLTNGVPVFAIDLMVSPLLLAGGYISDDAPMIPCMAEPGEKGRVMQLPYWFVRDNLQPSEAEQKALLLVLGVNGRWSREARFTASPA